jgi:hypothetical protein
MATKKELEETIKVLKKKVKDLEREKKDLTEKQEGANIELEGLPFKAVSILKSDGTSRNKVVVLRYDLESRRAMIEDEIYFSRASLHMATAKINKELADMLLNQRNKEE